MPSTKTENGYSASEIKSGKYLKVMIKVKENIIEELIIHGDFFAFPEDAIDVLEKNAKGKTLDDVLKFVDELDVHLVGISKEDLKGVIKKAFEGAKSL